MKAVQVVVPKQQVPEILQELHCGNSRDYRKHFAKIDISFCYNKYFSSKGPTVTYLGKRQQYIASSPFKIIAINVAGLLSEIQFGNQTIS